MTKCKVLKTGLTKLDDDSFIELKVGDIHEFSDATVAWLEPEGAIITQPNSQSFESPRFGKRSPAAKKDEVSE